MKKLSLLLAVVVLSASAWVFGWYVWPTPWRTQVLRNEGVDHMYRIHRSTARIEVLTRSGWRVVKPQDEYSGLSPAGRRALGLN